jgi:hypothetical protein
MGVAYNSKIVTSGLVLNLDTANSKSSRGRLSNVLSWNNWTVGSGGVSGYVVNGDGNSRLIDTSPYSTQDIVWDVSNQDATSDADGGFETLFFNIDPTKLYRFSVWIRRKTIGNGSTYLGPHSNWGEQVGNYILNRSDNAQNINPYFVAQNWWGVANTWYLVVGHVWPAGSGTGSAHPDTGIYAANGTKVSSATDYTWAQTNTTSFLRTYLYYSTDTSTNQQWYQPRVDIINDGYPTIADLLAGAGNTLYDMSPSKFDAAIINNNKFSVNVLPHDGSNDYVSLPSPSNRWSWTPSVGNGLTEFSLEMWIKSSDVDGLIFSKPWNGNGEYNYRAGHSQLILQIGNQSYSQNFSTMCTGNWECGVFIITPTQVAVYRNGLINAAFANHSITNAVPTSGNSNLPLAIMTLYPYGDGTWDFPTHAIAGDLAIFRMYNKVLTSDEVFQNYMAQKGRFGL